MFLDIISIFNRQNMMFLDIISTFNKQNILGYYM